MAYRSNFREYFSAKAKENGGKFLAIQVRQRDCNPFFGAPATRSWMDGGEAELLDRNQG